MNHQILYHLSLVLHITGLTMLAGTSLVNYITTTRFWKQHANDKLTGAVTWNLMLSFQFLTGIGILLLILSGVGMMALTHGVFGEQIWFRIKFVLVVIIITNALAIGRRQGRKVTKLLAAETRGEKVETLLLKAKNNLRWFQLIQIALFIIVFTLSVFKFN